MSNIELLEVVKRERDPQIGVECADKNVLSMKASAWWHYQPHQLTADEVRGRLLGLES